MFEAFLELQILYLYLRNDCTESDFDVLFNNLEYKNREPNLEWTRIVLTMCLNVFIESEMQKLEVSMNTRGCLKARMNLTFYYILSS